MTALRMHMSIAVVFLLLLAPSSASVEAPEAPPVAPSQAVDACIIGLPLSNPDKPKLEGEIVLSIAILIKMLREKQPDIRPSVFLTSSPNLPNADSVHPPSPLVTLGLKPAECHNLSIVGHDFDSRILPQIVADIDFRHLHIITCTCNSRLIKASLKPGQRLGFCSSQIVGLSANVNPIYNTQVGRFGFMIYPRSRGFKSVTKAATDGLFAIKQKLSDPKNLKALGKLQNPKKWLKIITELEESKNLKPKAPLDVPKLRLPKHRKVPVDNLWEPFAAIYDAAVSSVPTGIDASPEAPPQAAFFGYLTHDLAFHYDLISEKIPATLEILGSRSSFVFDLKQDSLKTVSQQVLQTLKLLVDEGHDHSRSMSQELAKDFKLVINGRDVANEADLRKIIRTGPPSLLKIVVTSTRR